MADATNELIYEVLKNVQERMTTLDEGQRAIHAELIAVRGHVHAVQVDINNIYERVAKMELRMDRIEKRLDLVSEPAQ
ncbi:MAG: hypothetical protein AB7S41_16285 [Parvibaculaceae bacterium]